MTKHLFIIEAPGKIDSYGAILFPLFGNDFKVIATRGRLFDIQGDDIGLDFQSGELQPWMPIDEDRVKFIRNEISLHQNVYVCTDDDIEGEVIASHVASLTDSKDIKRLVISAISKESISEALKSPSTINEVKVKSGISRRILDRFVGLTYSKHDYEHSDKRKLLNGNVGRILSPMLKELEERQFSPFTIVKHDDNGVAFKFDIPPTQYENIDKLLDKISFLQLPEIEVDGAFEQKSTENSVLDGYSSLKAIAQTLQVDVDSAAKILQDLYEKGRISYPRTDNSALSKETISLYAHMAVEYGIDQFSASNFEVKFSDHKIQGAHQGITLTNPKDVHPKKSVSDAHTIQEKAMIIINQSVIQAGSGSKPTEMVSFKPKSEGTDLERFCRAYDLNVRIEKPKRFKSHDAELSPYGNKRKPNRTSQTAAVYENDPTVYLLDLMYELNLGRPSTYPVHTKNIKKKYLKENGELNRRATNSIRLAESVSPNLSNPIVSSDTEDYLLFDSDDTIANKVVTAMEMMGVGADQIEMVRSSAKATVLPTKQEKGKENLYSPSSMGY